jgi:nitroimidazol reductase NimA-like FMN-containing flavoprotein (pyridoxamine 5'-phosphate oxidase superfamily)
MANYKNLSEQEIDTFLQNNHEGVLSMAGDKPYEIPTGYQYRRKSIIMGLQSKETGRKMGYLKNNKNICFTICMPRRLVPKLKDRCTSLVIEGPLEEVKNRSYYGLPPKKKAYPNAPEFKLYKLNPKHIGARMCT